MPFFIQPFFRKPFKLFAIDADTGQPLDPNVRKKTRVTYYEVQNGSNGSKRLVAHKTPSQTSKQADTKAEEAKKDGGEDSEDKPWTEAQDKTLIEMKKDSKNSNAMIGLEVGRAGHEVQARWRVINPNKGQNENAGKKDNGGGGGNQGEQTEEKNEGGNEQANSQGQGKKNKGGNNQNHNQQNKQNNKQNNNQQKNNDNNNKQNNKQNNKNDNNQNKSNDKPAAKQSTADEARFTMNDWLTLQEDDLFSFGELQCLSELIAKDLNQGWQRVAAKFFDLTGRRVHPDDVREKFESMAVKAEGKK